MITSKAKHKISSSKPVKQAVEKYNLCLYIAGLTPKAVIALKNLRLICEEKLKGQYRIEVRDLLLYPHYGRQHQILAIPTLVRTTPQPVKLIIGDLSDTAQLIAGLGIV